MKLITTLIIIVILSSCVTRRACLKKFSVNPDTVRVVSFKDSIIYRDTTFYITVPADTVIDTVMIPCPPPPPEFIPDTAKAETSFAKAVAWWNYPYIRLRLVQKDSTIQFRLDSAIREAYFWKNEYEKITHIVPVKKIPAFYKIAFWAWVAVLILIISAFIRQIVKVFFPKKI